MMLHTHMYDIQRHMEGGRHLREPCQGVMLCSVRSSTMTCFGVDHTGVIHIADRCAAAGCSTVFRGPHQHWPCDPALRSSNSTLSATRYAEQKPTPNGLVWCSGLL